MIRARRTALGFAVAILLLSFASACAHPSKGPAMTHSDAEGLWQQACEIPAPGAGGAALSTTYTFQYQAGVVTLRLLALGKVSWRSADDFYALKARWQGDMLQYLTPVGQWVDLASFEAGQFVALGDGKRREYDRITPDQVAEFSAGIVDPARVAFDYTRSMK